MNNKKSQDGLLPLVFGGISVFPWCVIIGFALVSRPGLDLKGSFFSATINQLGDAIIPIAIAGPLFAIAGIIVGFNLLKKCPVIEPSVIFGIVLSVLGLLPAIVAVLMGILG